MNHIKLPNVYLSRDIYRGFIDENHFLAQLEQVFDWHELAEPLLDLGNNEFGGRPRHASVTMLKMLFISFLFDQSDRETEFSATNNLLVKYFIGLPIDGKAPDHSSLSRFRDAVLEKKGVAFFDGMFRTITTQAKRRGIVFSTIQALDATHTVADVSKDSPQDPGSPRDPDASWGCKGNETRTAVGGTKVKIPKYFLGYKSHLIAEVANGFVTGIHVTPGNVADIDGGDWLVHRLLTDAERSGIDVLLADKGYACPVWMNLLQKYTGIMTAFSIPRSMTEKGDHMEKWLAYKNDEGLNAFRRDRYVIERVNADVKDNHSLRRCRYLGLTKYHLQAVMSSACHNAKLAMRILTGARLRTA